MNDIQISLHRLVAQKVNPSLISSSHLSTKSKGLSDRPPNSSSLFPESSKYIQKEETKGKGIFFN